MTQIILLGTGTPNADPARAGSAVAIVVNDMPYLFDFGPGVVRRAAAAQQKGITALAVQNLRHAFVTHLHSDHTAGYADLILTPWVLDRAEPLCVYGPVGLQAMTDHLLAAYSEDIRERTSGLQPGNVTGFEVLATEIHPGFEYRDANVTITAFPAVHGTLTAFGYRIVSADRTIVISGDTAPHDKIVEYYGQCDVLIHEVYSAVAFQRIHPEWQRYHSQVHTSTTELAQIAAQVRPGMLILYHQLFWGESEENLVAEIKQGYAGVVVSGRDLDVF